jgi:hypothetical protein
MSATELYRRALTRFAISLILTVIDGLSCLLALYNAVGNNVMFALILFLLVPLAWTLINIWQHTLRDLRRIQGVVTYTELERG